jgi:hypothetical protein
MKTVKHATRSTRRSANSKPASTISSSKTDSSDISCATTDSNPMSEFTDLFLPPILQTPGLRFVGLIRMPSGAIALKFTNLGDGDIREVIVYLITKGMVEYIYSIYDRNTSTTTLYQGIHGNQEDDEIVDMDAWPEL